MYAVKPKEVMVRPHADSTSGLIKNVAFSIDEVTEAQKALGVPKPMKNKVFSERMKRLALANQSKNQH
tara:strand:+ start:1859 stop:2062 length:204 start_codon:yes stop_codon:yes gene_type:complete